MGQNTSQLRGVGPWEKINTEYRAYLEESGLSKEDFNAATPAERMSWRKQQQQQQPESAYGVTAIVRGAKQSNGARGNVYKFLQRYLGLYSDEEGIQILYNGGDLSVKAYFHTFEKACQFQTALNDWEIHKELANLDGVTLDPLTPAKIDRPSDLKRIYLQNYEPQESESPCQTLNQLHSYRLSVPVTEPVEADTALARYQSIDKLVPHLQHYKCHLKDKAKFKQLQNDENNMVAASWAFHQQLDGLNVEEGMPLAAMSVKKASSGRSTAHADRYPVTLSIQFFFPNLAASFAAQELAHKGDNGTWETIVYVQDKSTFIECVEWKFQDTQKRWQEHRAFLDQE
jgi:hypothetical protein